MSGKIFWLTGLSGSGKSTVSSNVIPLLEKDHLKVRVIDGDEIRAKHFPNLGFEKKDIETSNTFVAQLALKEKENFDVILIPVIAPFDDLRVKIKTILDKDVSFIYCAANLESVMKRDVKGLYKKAEAGIIPNMIGFSQGYEYQIPSNPDLILQTGHNGQTLENCVEQLHQFILKKINS